MKIRIGSTTPTHLKKGKTCTMCGEKIQDKGAEFLELDVVHDDYGSKYDGQEHRLVWCEACYDHILSMNKHYVVRDNTLEQVDYALAMDGMNEEDIKKEKKNILRKEKERLDALYYNQLQA